MKIERPSPIAGHCRKLPRRMLPNSLNQAIKYAGLTRSFSTKLVNICCPVKLPMTYGGSGPEPVGGGPRLVAWKRPVAAWGTLRCIPSGGVCVEPQ